LTIFVHRASEHLTDHDSHGDGLICFSLLNGLAKRGHRIYAYSEYPAVARPHPNLIVSGRPHVSPANALAPWEHAWRAERWLGQLLRARHVDLVWRMHPYGADGCPRPPRTFGRPLIVGPLFYEWPAASNGAARGHRRGVPRFGVGIGRALRPIGQRGWRRTLRAASLILCATAAHARRMMREVPGARAQVLPVIVDGPSDHAAPRAQPPADQPLRLVFVGNLVASKRPALFCEIVKMLDTRGLATVGTIIGDGPERGEVERCCAASGIADRINFLGKRPNTEVFGLVREADWLVSTSFGEPYGRNIAEAMSVGTPCICHRSGGPADFIGDGEDGVLVDRLEAGAYADAIARIRAEAGGWKRMSDAARRRAEEWTSEAVIARLEAQLIHVVAEHDGARMGQVESNGGGGVCGS
jgi:glycosyltransferase involved in cell wall biosynthesis